MKKGGRECAHEPLFGTFFPSGPLGVLLGGPGSPKRTPRVPKRSPGGPKRVVFGSKSVNNPSQNQGHPATRKQKMARAPPGWATPRGTGHHFNIMALWFVWPGLGTVAGRPAGQFDIYIYIYIYTPAALVKNTLVTKMRYSSVENALLQS